MGNMGGRNRAQDSGREVIGVGGTYAKARAAAERKRKHPGRGTNVESYSYGSSYALKVRNPGRGADPGYGGASGTKK